MKKYFTLLKLFNNTIKDLKKNPKSITPYKSKEDETNPTVPISYVGGQVAAFIEYFIKNNLIDFDYKKNYENIKNKPVEQLSYLELITYFTYIIKEDKNEQGLLYYKYQDGTFLKLIKRLKKHIFKLM